jgi:hemerythrin
MDFTEDMKIGIPHIDRQHEELVEFLNKVCALCGANPSRGEIEAGLDFLASYVATHFHDEEQLQIESGYPGCQEHMEKHGAFIVDFLSIKAEYMEYETTSKNLALILAKRVVEWAHEHIKGDDAEFGKYYNQVRGSANVLQ